LSPSQGSVTAKKRTVRTRRSFAGEIECTISGILIFRLFSLLGLFFVYLEYALSTCFISNNHTGSNLTYEKATFPLYFLSPKAFTKQGTELFPECALALLLKKIGFLVTGHVFKKWCQSVYSIDVNLCCRKTMNQTTLAAFIAHEHGILCISVHVTLVKLPTH
jgi:hypothetical protein